MSPPAQLLGGFHPVRMLHLDVENDHVKAAAPQQGASAGKAVDGVSGNPFFLHIACKMFRKLLGHLRLVVADCKFYHIPHHIFCPD